MYTHIQTYILIFAGFLITVALFMTGTTMYVTNHRRQSAQQAVETAILDARNDNARIAPKVYALNKTKFESELEPTSVSPNKINVYGWTKNTRISFEYLVDTQGKIALIQAGAQTNDKLYPIKAVKVKVTDTTNSKNNQVITYVVTKDN